jgi:hypothetical protein
MTVENNLSVKLDLTKKDLPIIHIETNGKPVMSATCSCTPDTKMILSIDDGHSTLVHFIAGENGVVPLSDEEIFKAYAVVSF